MIVHFVNTSKKGMLVAGIAVLVSMSQVGGAVAQDVAANPEPDHIETKTKVYLPFISEDFSTASPDVMPLPEDLTGVPEEGEIVTDQGIETEVSQEGEIQGATTDSLMTQGMVLQTYVSHVDDATTPGYVVVSMTDGSTVELPDSPELRALNQTSATGGAESFSRVYGNCGSSYIYFSGGNNRFTFTTGFSLYPPRRAIAYYWRVNVKGPHGWSRNISRSGSLFRRSWWQWRPLPYPAPYAGRHEMRVSGLSSVILSNKAVCVSGQPGSWGYVY